MAVEAWLIGSRVSWFCAPIVIRSATDLHQIQSPRHRPPLVDPDLPSMGFHFISASFLDDAVESLVSRRRWFDGRLSSASFVVGKGTAEGGDCHGPGTNGLLVRSSACCLKYVPTCTSFRQMMIVSSSQ